jgi:hypothetical protein
VNRLSTAPLYERSVFALSWLAAGSLALGAAPVLAQEHPPQREWVYTVHADVVSGDQYPAALLMSPKVVKPSENAAGLGHGYLAIGNYSKRPMEVTLAWDEASLWKPGDSKCKPGGCEVSVRFGTTSAMKFTAVQDKHSPTLILHDGHALIGAAARHVGLIEVEVRTMRNGLVAMQFATASRLETAKLSTGKK